MKEEKGYHHHEAIASEIVEDEKSCQNLDIDRTEVREP